MPGGSGCPLHRFMEINFCFNEMHQKLQFCVTSSKRSVAPNQAKNAINSKLKNTYLELFRICSNFSRICFIPIKTLIFCGFDELHAAFAWVACGTIALFLHLGRSRGCPLNRGFTVNEKICISVISVTRKKSKFLSMRNNCIDQEGSQFS